MKAPAPRERVTAQSLVAREFGSVIDIVIAPSRAFAIVKETSPWRAAFAITILINVIAVALQEPAIWHVSVATSPELHRLSRADLLSAEQGAPVFLGLQAAIAPVFTAGLFALGMTFATPRTVLEGRRLATFFSLALTAGIPASLGVLATGILVAMHPATSYGSFAQLNAAFPDSLAVLARPDIPAEQNFLGSIDIFSIWSILIIAYGYGALTGSSLNRSLVVAFGCAIAVVLGNLVQSVPQ